jgi:hypothetical protein
LITAASRGLPASAPSIAFVGDYRRDVRLSGLRRFSDIDRQHVPAFGGEALRGGAAHPRIRTGDEDASGRYGLFIESLHESFQLKIKR